MTLTITGTQAVRDEFAFTEAAGGSTPPTSGNIFTNDGGLTNVSRIANNFVTVNVDADGESIAGILGDLLIRSDGSFVYTPNETVVSSLVTGAVTADTFTYTASAGGASSQALLQFIITGSDDPLVATPQTWLPVYTGTTLPQVVQQLNPFGGNVQQGFLLNAGRDPDSFPLDVVVGSVPTTATVSNPFGRGFYEIDIFHDQPFQESLTVTGITPIFGADPLAFGQVLNVTVPFFLTSPGSPDTPSSVSFQIIGNAPPVGVDDVETVVEAGAAGAGTPTANSNVLTNDTDADSGSGDTKTVTAVFGSPAIVGANIQLGFSVPAGGFGTSTVRINADGTYAVTLDNASMDFLRRGDTATATISYAVTDSLGASSTANLEIRIEGDNDAPVANDDVFHVGALGVDGQELRPPIPGLASVGVSINDRDPDRGDVIQSLEFEHFDTGSSVAADANFQELVGSFGSLFVTLSGDYFYVIDDSNSAVGGLAAGETLTDRFNYTRTDGAGASGSANLDIVIHGEVTTLAPQTDFGIATEAGGNFNQTAGSDATGNVLGNDGGSDTRVVAVLTDADIGDGDYRGAFNTVPDGSNVATAVSGQYGTLFVDAAGTYRYVVDDNNTEVENLAPGVSLSETLYYFAEDAFGQRQLGQLEIQIDGRNDAPRVTPATITIEREGIAEPLFLNESGIGLLEFAANPEGESLLATSVTVTVGGLTSAAGTTLPTGFTIDFDYNAGDDDLLISQQQFEFLQKAFAGVDSFGNASGTPDVLTVYIDYDVVDSSGRTPDHTTHNRITLQIQGDSDYVSAAGSVDTVDFDDPNMAFNRTFVHTVINDDFTSVAQDILINFDNTENRIDISDLIRGSSAPTPATLGAFVRATNNFGANSIDPSDDFIEIFVDPDGAEDSYSEFNIGRVTGTNSCGGGGPLGSGDTISVVFDQAQAAERLVVP